MNALRLVALFSVLLATVQTGTAYAQQTAYTVGFSSVEATAGQPIEIEWTAPPGSRSLDWIGLYRVGASDRNFLAWKYIPDSGTAGVISLSFAVPGTYEARLFTNDGFQRGAVSPTNVRIQVTQPPEPVGQYELLLQAGTYQPSEAIVVEYTTPSQRSTKLDWVGIYRIGASDRSFVSWKYVPDSSSSGSLTFNIAPSGTYEARFFVNDSFKRVATSPQRFTIATNNNGNPGETSYTLTVSPTSTTAGQNVTVNYQAPSGVSRTRDWVGLYRTNDIDRAYISWKYIGSTPNGSLSFSVPAVGSYEFRYFKNDGYQKVATSPTVVVGSSGGAGGQCTVADLGTVVNYPPESGPVIAFGDSLTAGVGATTDQDYVSQLERLLAINILNEGVSGDTTEEALTRLQSDVLARNPSVVIVWLGGNDIISRFYERAEAGLEELSTVEWLSLLTLRLTGKIPQPAGITEAETFANITEIVERIQATGAITIVVGFSGGLFDEDLEMMYQQVAENTGSLYVPNALNGVLGRPSLMSDLVHPNSAGYGIVASRIAPYLACVLPD